MSERRPQSGEQDACDPHDLELARDLLAMSPRQRLEELAVVEAFFGRAQRRD